MDKYKRAVIVAGLLVFAFLLTYFVWRFFDHPRFHLIRANPNCVTCRLKQRWQRSKDYVRSAYKGTMRYIARRRARSRSDTFDNVFLGPDNWTSQPYHYSEYPTTPPRVITPHSRLLRRITLSGRPFNFLNLPFDIRRMIYEAFVTSLKIVNCHPTILLSPCTKFLHSTALLRTCSQIRFEFHPILFTSAFFRISERYPFYRHLRLPFRKHIRELRLDISTQTRHHHRRESTFEVLEEVTSMQNLRDLHIHFTDARDFSLTPIRLFLTFFINRYVMPRFRFLLVEVISSTTQNHRVQIEFGNFQRIVRVRSGVKFETRCGSCTHKIVKRTVTHTKESFAIKDRNYVHRFFA